MNNIILIGMPGCGKTFYGKKISKEYGVNFIDLDEYLVEKNNMTIEEMFEKGEEFFRDKESEAVRDMRFVENTIIATGGGVVKREENMNILLNCGYVVFIHREPEKIIKYVDTSTRPLLRSGKDKIYSLHDERYDLYKLYANEILDNNSTTGVSIKKLRKILEVYQFRSEPK